MSDWGGSLKAENNVNSIYWSQTTYFKFRSVGVNKNFDNSISSTYQQKDTIIGIDIPFPWT